MLGGCTPCDFAPLYLMRSKVLRIACALEFEDHRPLYDWVVAKCPEVGDDAWVLGCCARPVKAYEKRTRPSPY